MRWARVLYLLTAGAMIVVAAILTLDALDGLHFYTVQGDLGRKSLAQAGTSLPEKTRIVLGIATKRNPAVARAFAVELLASLLLLVVGFRRLHRFRSGARAMQGSRERTTEDAVE